MGKLSDEFSLTENRNSRAMGKYRRMRIAR
jgi:hypothetical protein